MVVSWPRRVSGGVAWSRERKALGMAGTVVGLVFSRGTSKLPEKVSLDEALSAWIVAVLNGIRSVVLPCCPW